MTAYYNEHDPFAAQWLRNLIGAGLIAPGIVDDRSIMDVSPDELKEFTQCHFFAGIGGWSVALRLAGWRDERPVWTGSCPCQPFSDAGKKRGARDERHLWPVFCELIRARRPDIVFGEQVASAAVVGTVKGDRPASAGDAPVWFDGVSADLEAEGYAVGAAVLGAHSVGAPHIRQRLFWVADSACERWHGGEDSTGATRWRGTENRGWLGDSISSRSQGHTGHGDGVSESGRLDEGPAGSASQAGCPGGVSDTEHAAGSPERLDDAGERSDAGPADGAVSRHDRGGTFWSGCRVVPCRDRKARRIGPSTSVLAHGVQRGLVELCSGEETHTYSRTGALKGLGNAIVPQVAAEFVTAFLDCR